MTTREHVRIDGLAEPFLRLEESMNVNANQIIVVDGVIESDKLRRAITGALAEFPLLLSSPTPSGREVRRGAWRPEEIALRVLEYPGSMDMREAPFRRFLLDLSEAHPVRWQNGPPVQFVLVRGDRGCRSCLLMNSHHGVGDAKGDSLLVSEIMKRYGALHTGGGADVSGSVEPQPAGRYDFRTLEETFPDSYKISARIRAAVVGAWSVFVDVVTKDVRLQVPSARSDTQRETGNRPRLLDFHHEVLDEKLQSALIATSRATTHTINTLFSGALARLMGRSAAPVGMAWKARFLCAYSLRPHAGPQSRDDYRNFMVPCNLRIPVGVGTEDLLREIGSQVKRLRSGAIFSQVARFANLGRMLRVGALRKRAPWIMSMVQGSNACYSNPGVIEERFTHFGTSSLPIIGYIGFGCLVPPYHFILYTPMIHGQIHLNAVYRADIYGNFETYFVAPLKNELWRIIKELAGTRSTETVDNEGMAQLAGARASGRGG